MDVGFYWLGNHLRFGILTVVSALYEHVRGIHIFEQLFQLVISIFYQLFFLAVRYFDHQIRDFTLVFLLIRVAEAS